MKLYFHINAEPEIPFPGRRVEVIKYMSEGEKKKSMLDDYLILQPYSLAVQKVGSCIG